MTGSSDHILTDRICSFQLDERIIERLRSHEERDGSDSLNNDLQNIAARQRLENRLRLIIDTTPALIHTSRPDGYLDYFNKRWVEYLGVSLEDVEGWKWTASVHPDGTLSDRRTADGEFPHRQSFSGGHDDVHRSVPSRVQNKVRGFVAGSRRSEFPTEIEQHSGR